MPEGEPVSRSSKVRRVMNLRRQFGGLTRVQLSADQIFEALEALRLVEAVEYSPGRIPTKYRETMYMHSLPPDLFQDVIREVLERYLRRLV